MPGTKALRTKRTTLKRLPKRGVHDFDTIARILDEGLYCHVGFVADGQPFVVPTGYGRDGRALYIHGSAASRMLRALSEGVPVCVTVTLFDGLVLARSAFHNSINYRSVVVLGVARPVEGDEKLHGLRTITEHITPGRWADVRGPTAQELKATTVLRLGIDEASAKIRTGGPIDDEEDLALPVWAGVLPFALVPQPPVPEAVLPSAVAPPPYVSHYARPNGGKP
jgi:nitroimidazol reductase NimA-like FMN-containing flavoprotein (pyridoxamine 5'-phosphate oxidase superfamily)